MTREQGTLRQAQCIAGNREQGRGFRQLYFSLHISVFSVYLLTELVAVNSQDLEALGWRFLRERPLKTAQGIKTFRIYLGKVRIDGREFEIPVYGGEEITEILLGSQWLKIMRLVADMSADVLSLEIV